MLADKSERHYLNQLPTYVSLYQMRRSNRLRAARARTIIFFNSPEFRQVPEGRARRPHCRSARYGCEGDTRRDRGPDRRAPHLQPRALAARREIPAVLKGGQANGAGGCSQKRIARQRLNELVDKVEAEIRRKNRAFDQPSRPGRGQGLADSDKIPYRGRIFFEPRVRP